MILKSRNNTVTVKVDGSRIIVAGRRYESAHVMILDASRIELVASPAKVSIDASFDVLPEIHDSTPHLLRVGIPGSSLELDLEGRTIEEVRDDSNLVIRGSILTFKFESSEDGDRIVVKIPRLEPLRVTSLRMHSEAPTSVNAIIDPFIVGVVTIKPEREARLTIPRGEDRLEIMAR